MAENLGNYCRRPPRREIVGVATEKGGPRRKEAADAGCTCGATDAGVERQRARATEVCEFARKVSIRQSIEEGARREGDIGG